PGTTRVPCEAGLPVCSRQRSTGDCGAAKSTHRGNHRIGRRDPARGRPWPAPILKRQTDARQRRCTMLGDALNRTKQYGELAKGCRRLAAIGISTETRDHFLRMAEHDSALAEAEEAGVSRLAVSTALT